VILCDCLQKDLSSTLRKVVLNILDAILDLESMHVAFECWRLCQMTYPQLPVPMSSLLCALLLTSALGASGQAALSTWKHKLAPESNGEEKHFRTRLGHLMPGDSW